MGSVEPSFIYLLGVGVGHSIAPPVHNYISRTLGCDWQFKAVECPSLQDAVTLIRQPNCAGAIVTMPYKHTIMKHLDGLDDLALQLGACNNIYIAQDGTLRGTNTDWRGIVGCLIDGQDSYDSRTAMIVGAGGAARAALYALANTMKCKTVYVVNREDHEVVELMKEIKANYPNLDVMHVKTSEQAKGLPSPHYIVGTIPDVIPVSSAELEVYQILEIFLSQATLKGLLLDMCYKPRRTRMLKLAERHGWKGIEGTAVIGHQIEEQYRLWCGEDAVPKLPLKEAWEVLHETSENSKEINF